MTSLTVVDQVRKKVGEYTALRKLYITKIKKSHRGRIISMQNERINLKKYDIDFPWVAKVRHHRLL
jgi:hypothetical protein